MSFVGTGNKDNHWDNERAIKVLREYYTSLEIERMTPKQRITKASTIMYIRRLEFKNRFK